ncbi:MAG: hypothetical protein DRQ99_30510, partial [Candidatus Parabeggiatoa sp. nov. 3]
GKLGKLDINCQHGRIFKAAFSKNRECETFELLETDKVFPEISEKLGVKCLNKAYPKNKLFQSFL